MFFIKNGYIYGYIIVFFLVWENGWDLLRLGMFMLEKLLDFLFVFEFKVCFFIGFDDVDEYFYFF